MIFTELLPFWQQKLNQNKNKQLDKLSPKKWASFTQEKKIIILREYFLSLEYALNDKSNISDILVLFLKIAPYLHKETDLSFQKISHIIKDMGISVVMGIAQNNSRDIGKQLYDRLRPIFNEEITLQKDFHFLPKITQKDQEKENKKLPIILILDNLRSAFNVGSIFRTAECLNIKEILLTGNTPTPDNFKVKNTAMGTETRVEWKFYKDTQDAILYAKKNGYQVFALETVEKATSIYDKKYIDNIAFVLGNEALGISMEVILLCDECLQLPLLGWKNSLNVATACAVTCFEVYRQIISK